MATTPNNNKRKRAVPSQQQKEDEQKKLTTTTTTPIDNHSSSSDDEQTDDVTSSKSSDSWGDFQPKTNNNNNNKSSSISNLLQRDLQDLNLSDEDDEELDDEESGEELSGEDNDDDESEDPVDSDFDEDDDDDEESGESDDDEGYDGEIDNFSSASSSSKKVKNLSHKKPSNNNNNDSDSDDDEVEVFETFTNYDNSENSETGGNHQESKQDKKQPSLFDDVDLSDDSSEDEGIINTVGNIPLEWYEEYDHIGYDRDGHKILRRKKKDSLDNLLARHDDPNYIRTVYDELNDREHVLSNADLQMIIDVQKGRYPTGFDPYKDYVDYVKVDSRFPLVGVPDPKSRFTPNRMEQNNIAKLAARMRKNPKIGVPQPPKRSSQCYLMWGADGSLIGDKVPRVGLLQAPKPRLPGHTFSYNPPPEYIRNEDNTPKYDAMRKVPAFNKFVEEQYKRCLDLYMAPRTLPKKKAQNPERLLPELPKPEELRPYPEIPSIVYEGHGDIVRKVSVDPTGRWIVTGSDDSCVRLYESKTGRLVNTWQFEDSISWVEWNPNSQLNLIAVAVQRQVYLIQPTMTGTEKTNQATKDLFPTAAYTEDISLFADEGEEQQQERMENGGGGGGTDEAQANGKNSDDDDDKQDEQQIHSTSKTGRKKILLKWVFYREEEDKEKRSKGLLVRLEHLKPVTQVTWHYRGDYFCTLAPDAMNDGIVIHQLSKRQSQKPFKKRMKNKGNKVVRVLFHPKLPQFFVSTSVGVKVYNLQKQRLFKKFKGQRCRYISSMAIHPTGGHVLTGGFDKRSEWFDMELSSRPFKTLRYHNRSVRSVAFHPRYPLFATASDDGTVHVFHASVFDDWLKDPVIVPLKVLRGHRVVNHLGVLDIQFHPTQPWLFSCGADQTARLWIS